MIPKSAIDKAIQGGWKPCDIGGPYRLELIPGGVWFHGPHGGCYFEEEKIALDRSFWRSLARALERPDWSVLAHRFLDAVFSDKDFWGDVLRGNDRRAQDRPQA